MTVDAETAHDGWDTLQTIASAYDTYPDCSADPMVLVFVQNFAQSFPCKVCSGHFVALVAQHSPRGEFFGWVVDRHNDVNARLGKRTMTYPQVRATFRANWGAVWRHWHRCSVLAGNPEDMRAAGACVLAGVELLPATYRMRFTTLARRRPPPRNITHFACWLSQIHDDINLQLGKQRWRGQLQVAYGYDAPDAMARVVCESESEP
jgi:hypothetical protein